MVIPPHVTAVLSAEAEHNRSQRDWHILSIAALGRLGWQQETSCGPRALVEAAMDPYKAIIRFRLRARSFSGQKAEAAVHSPSQRVKASRCRTVEQPGVFHPADVLGSLQPSGPEGWVVICFKGVLGRGKAQRMGVNVIGVQGREAFKQGHHRSGVPLVVFI